MRLILFAVACLLSNSPSGADLTDVQRATARVMSGNSLGSGTCFFATDEALFVLTNNHVAGRAGNQTRCEFWDVTGQPYTVPGRVIASKLTRGYVDVAIIEISRASLPATGSRIPAVVPLAPAATPAADAGPWTSGCPGGRWPCIVRCQLIDSADADSPTVQFYPKPAGGRSGSGLFNPEGTHLVGLVAWSSGGNPQQHNLDGSNAKSGHGIAMPVETVWAVLRGTDLPTETRVEATIPTGLQQDDETQADLRGRRRREQPAPEQEPAPETPDAHSAPEQGESVDEALLRLRRGMAEAPGEAPSNSFQPQTRRRPVLATARLVAQVALIGGGMLILAALYLGYRYIRSKLPPAAGLLLFAFAAGSCSSVAIAQTPNQQPELAALLTELSAEPVAELPMLTVPDAMDEAAAVGRPVLVLFSMDGCAPCQQVKDSLAELVAAGRMNQVAIAGAMFDDTEALAHFPGLVIQSVPVMALYVPQPDACDPLTGEAVPQPPRRMTFVGGATTAALLSRLEAAGIDTTATETGDLDCPPDVTELPEPAPLPMPTPEPTPAPRPPQLPMPTPAPDAWQRSQPPNPFRWFRRTSPPNGPTSNQPDDQGGP